MRQPNHIEDSFEMCRNYLYPIDGATPYMPLAISKRSKRPKSLHVAVPFPPGLLPQKQLIKEGNSDSENINLIKLKQQFSINHNKHLIDKYEDTSLISQQSGKSNFQRISNMHNEVCSQYQISRVFELQGKYTSKLSISESQIRESKHSRTVLEGLLKSRGDISEEQSKEYRLISKNRINPPTPPQPTSSQLFTSKRTTSAIQENPTTIKPARDGPSSSQRNSEYDCRRNQPSEPNDNKQLLQMQHKKKYFQIREVDHLPNSGAVLAVRDLQYAVGGTIPTKIQQAEEDKTTTHGKKHFHKELMSSTTLYQESRQKINFQASLDNVYRSPASPSSPSILPSQKLSQEIDSPFENNSNSYRQSSCKSLLQSSKTGGEDSSQPHLGSSLLKDSQVNGVLRLSPIRRRRLISQNGVQTPINENINQVLASSQPQATPTSLPQALFPSPPPPQLSSLQLVQSQTVSAPPSKSYNPPAQAKFDRQQTMQSNKKPQSQLKKNQTSSIRSPLPVKNKHLNQTIPQFQIRVTSLQLPANAPAPEVSSKCWAVVSIGLSSNNDASIPRSIQIEYLSGKAATSSVEIASLTKIMTCFSTITFFETHGLSLEKTFFQVSSEATQMIGTTANLEANDYLSAYELLFGLMLPSGNDAATVLAEGVGYMLLRFEQGQPLQLTPLKDNLAVTNKSKKDIGGNSLCVVSFLKEMNRLARNLSMDRTFYACVHGLPNRNSVSSARDVALLSCVAMQHTLFAKVVNTQDYSTISALDSHFDEQEQYEWENTNSMLEKNGYDGVKTGVTETAGPCLATSFKYLKHTDQPRRLVCVLLNCKSMDERWVETKSLINWAKRTFLDKE